MKVFKPLMFLALIGPLLYGDFLPAGKWRGAGVIQIADSLYQCDDLTTVYSHSGNQLSLNAEKYICRNMEKEEEVFSHDQIQFSLEKDVLYSGNKKVGTSTTNSFRFYLKGMLLPPLFPAFYRYAAQNISTNELLLSWESQFRVLGQWVTATFNGRYHRE